MASLNFDISKIEIEENSFELLPDGNYVAVISSEEMKQTKAGTGHYLSLKLEIIEGKSKGRVLFDIINIDNPNAQAVSIAQQTLGKICIAIGKQTLEDSSEMLNIPLIIKVGTSPAQNGYDASNRVKTYLPISSGVSATTPASNTAPTQQAATKKPWEK
ncbi:DUF669 domain-containing protein [bacterium]|nr:DUF669 domain-containing protein [bacterium]MBU1958629.1 DUF669 domain-containing protein [bacterium]